MSHPVTAATKASYMLTGMDSAACVSKIEIAVKRSMASLMCALAFRLVHQCKGQTTKPKQSSDKVACRVVPEHLCRTIPLRQTGG
jgi:hypothetical protein